MNLFYPRGFCRKARIDFSAAASVRIVTLLDQHALDHLYGLGYQEWVEIAPERVEIMCGLYGLSNLQPIHGGRSGAVARCTDSDGKRLILKAMLPGDFLGQVLALRSMDGHHTPRLVAYESELKTILIEDLGGAPYPQDQEVDLEQAAEILLNWQNLTPEPGLPNQYERVEYWAGMTLPKVREIGDAEVERALGWAMEFSKSLPNGGLILHADLGRHNLLLGGSGEVLVVDPTGAVGDLAYDAGSLAVWGGKSVLNAPNRCLLLAEFLARPLEEIEAWAAVRCALSSGFAAARGELNRRADCLYTMLELMR